MSVSVLRVTRRRWLLVLLRRQRLVVRRHGLAVLLVLVRRRWLLVLHQPGLRHSEPRARRLLRRRQLQLAWLQKLAAQVISNFRSSTTPSALAL